MCEDTIRSILDNWRVQLKQVLDEQGTVGPAWDRLWADLRYYRIDERNGLDILRPVGLAYLERQVSFAFADGVIEPQEMTGFEEAVGYLQIIDPAVEVMRRRMRRGLELSDIRNGNLPRVQATMLHLEMDEIVHLAVNATQVRYLASGPKRNQGRLIATNKKLRFVGAIGGSELAWAKIIEVAPEYRRVVVSATTGRGGGTYEVSDPEYAAAVLSGVLRIAKRLVIAPGQRDSRSIPQEMKATVWQRDGGACAQCRAMEYLEFDHIIPHSRGGATSINNLQLLCRRCNLEKGARI